MPKITKQCVLCSRWIKKSRRKRNDLCVPCIEKTNEEWYTKYRKKKDAHL